MRTSVFLGPSLPRAEAERLLEAEYLPPVAMGDLYTLVASRARAGDRIAIIDGLFEQVPAVWHKEILYALSKGISVFGASSMGALRAAELHTFGMQGVGRIFAAFRDGLIDCDDEVAVAHADAEKGYRPLSTAMVSIRFAIEDAVLAQRLSPSLGSRLIEEARNLPYGKRSWAQILACAAARGEDAETLPCLRELAAAEDAKARDARLLLQTLARDHSGAEQTFNAAFTFHATSFWEALTASMALRVENAGSAETSHSQAERAQIARFARAGDPERERLMEAALLDRIALEFATGYHPEKVELRDAELRIARRNGLRNAPALLEWRQRQGLGAAEWEALIRREARRHWLMRAFIPQLDSFLIARLKAEGRYAAVRAAWKKGRQAVERGSIDKPSLADFGLTPQLLQDWYESRLGPMVPNPDSHAMALGFSKLRDFIDTLLQCYWAEQDGSEAEELEIAASTGKEFQS